MMSNSTAMAMAHGSALILVECMERCRVGFGRAESTYINIIGAFLNWKMLLLLLGVRDTSCDCFLIPLQWR